MTKMLKNIGKEWREKKIYKILYLNICIFEYKMSEETCSQMEQCAIKPTPSPTCAGMWEYSPTPTPACCVPIKEESEVSDGSEEPKEESDVSEEPKEKIVIMTWDQTKFLQNILNIVPKRVGFTFEEFNKIKPLKERVDGILMVKNAKYEFKNDEIKFLGKVLPILARRGAFNLAEFEDVSTYYKVLEKFLKL